MPAWRTRLLPLLTWPQQMRERMLLSSLLQVRRTHGQGLGAGNRAALMPAVPG